MADFVTVMSQFMRLCDSYENCDNCPVCQAGFNCACDNQGYSKTGAAELEYIIMAWVAEHPERVYPTWEEWLSDKYNLAYNDDFRLAMSREHIPADIAEKLGIEPKEG